MSENEDDLSYSEESSSDDEPVEAYDCPTYPDSKSYAEDKVVYERIKRNDPAMHKLAIIPAANDTLDDKEWKQLGRVLGRNTAIEYLKMYMYLGTNFVCPGLEWDLFLQGFCHNKTLSRLRLRFFNFSWAATFEYLCPLLRENPNLICIELIECSLRDQDLWYLCSSLRSRRRSSLPGLGKISLNGNKFSYQGCIELATLLSSPASRRLKYLYLNGNNIGDVGAFALAEALSGNNDLQYLHLQRNPIGDEGAIAFAKALTSNNKLRCLNLLDGKTNITSRGWDAFSEVIHNKASIYDTIQSNHKLEYLWYPMPHSAAITWPHILKLGDELLFPLKTNSEYDESNPETSAPRIKAFHTHLSGNFNLSPFLDMPLGALPRALGWIGKEYDTLVNCDMGVKSFSVFYRIIRNLPDICCFTLPPKKLHDRIVGGAMLKAESENHKQDEMASNKRPRHDTYGADTSTYK